MRQKGRDLAHDRSGSVAREVARVRSVEKRHEVGVVVERAGVDLLVEDFGVRGARTAARLGIQATAQKFEPRAVLLVESAALAQDAVPPHHGRARGAERAHESVGQAPDARDERLFPARRPPQERDGRDPLASQARQGAQLARGALEGWGEVRFRLGFDQPHEERGRLAERPPRLDATRDRAGKGVLVRPGYHGDAQDPGLADQLAEDVVDLRVELHGIQPTTKPAARRADTDYVDRATFHRPRAVPAEPGGRAPSPRQLRTAALFALATALALAVIPPSLPGGKSAVPPGGGAGAGDAGAEIAPPAAGAPAAAGLLFGRPLDLNRATVHDLEALPGIGKARATAIVEARARRGGRFERAEDLLDVPGIGPATLARLRPLVTVAAEP